MYRTWKGVWLNLVNQMCASLTDQVRSIAVVTTAVARGDLTQKIENRQGEMSTLKGPVNSMWTSIRVKNRIARAFSKLTSMRCV
ncbi:hypothetical protein BYT27DRAFT_6702097 [Phlegmacium glaucopus]|nr:hypothetical protein BYT27DRAFT_6702097 [Phlegmacium glaucopus]